jgi:hypothetical protein
MDGREEASYVLLVVADEQTPWESHLTTPISDVLFVVEDE